MVSMLTLLVSFGLALLSFMIFLIGIPPASGGAGSIILNRLYVWFPPFLALFGFAASIALFAGVHSKLLWRMMVVFCLCSFGICCGGHTLGFGTISGIGFHSGSNSQY